MKHCMYIVLFIVLHWIYLTLHFVENINGNFQTKWMNVVFNQKSIISKLGSFKVLILTVTINKV